MHSLQLIAYTQFSVGAGFPRPVAWIINLGGENPPLRDRKIGDHIMKTSTKKYLSIICLLLVGTTIAIGNIGIRAVIGSNIVAPELLQGVGCVTATSGGAWQNVAFSPQSGTFTAEFDATPS